MQDNNLNQTPWEQAPNGAGPDNYAQNNAQPTEFFAPDNSGNAPQNQYGEQPQQQYNNYQQYNNQPQQQYNNYQQYNNQPQYDNYQQYNNQPQYDNYQQYNNQPQYDNYQQYNNQPQYDNYQQYNNQPQYDNYQQYDNQQTTTWNPNQVPPVTPAWEQQIPTKNKANKAMRTAKKKKSKLPIIIAIVVSVFVLAAVAIGFALMFGGKDKGGDKAVTTVTTTAAAVATVEETEQTAETEPAVETTAATSSNIQEIVNPDGTKEVVYYASNGNPLRKEFFDASGVLTKTQTFLGGEMVSEIHYENGKMVYQLHDDGNTKTVTTYNRDANGKTVDGVVTVYDNSGKLLEEQILNPYENPVIIKYYSDGKLERTRTYIISAAGTRDGYIDEFVDGRRFKYDMQGNPISEVTTAATTKKEVTTAKTTAKTESKPDTGGKGGNYTETTGWVNDRKVDTTYSANGTKIREVTYKKIGSREVEMLRYEYATNPKTKTEYNRHPSTGDVTRTIYWEFKQNPNNYTLYMIKDESGKITKYESYERDDNGKILRTFMHDTATGEILYYIQHESHGNYKYSTDGKYLGTA